MSVEISNGLYADILQEGARLEVTDRTGQLLFAVSSPDNSIFYHFVEHAVHGVCPIVSFDPVHKINGWCDWFYLINCEGQQVERLNPWR